MKKLSLKSLKLGANDLLQREQLKTVFGGYSDGPCANGASGELTYWSCGDGSNSGSAYVCPEHAQAFEDMIIQFCN